MLVVTKKISGFGAASPIASDEYPMPDMTNVSQWAKTFFEMGRSHLTAVPTLTPSQVARIIDTQLGDYQKFWRHEILQAAKLLSDVYAKYDKGYNLWAISLMNNMGWRVVEYIACPPDQTLDPVSRKCMTKMIESDIIPPVIEEKKNYLPFIAIGLLAVMLIMRKKEKKS